MKRYTVYMHKNKKNGKVYIGITDMEPEKRWANGKAYGHCSRFNNAIKKYGWKNFDHLIIKRNVSKQEAIDTERALIKEFNSQNPDYGYNLTSGGEHYEHNEETKGLMSLRRKQMKGKFTVEARKAISDGLKGNKNNRRAVCQYDAHTGKLVNKYETLTLAAKAVGVGPANISLACSGRAKTSAGYIWKYEDDSTEINCNEHKSKMKHTPVSQFTKDGQFIATYQSITEAARRNNLDQSAISKACRGKFKTVGGFVWKYADEKI